MNRMPRLALLMVLGGGTSLFTPAQAASMYDPPSPRWRSGPVRYLLTAAESRVYKKLATDSDRMAFVEAFWRRRDPTPETPVNEFKDEFEKRVAETESLRFYGESTKEMWLTDMGKIYILLGPPLFEDRQQVASSDRDTVVWSFDRTSDSDESHFNVAFVADESGELRFSVNPTLDRNTWKGLSPPTALKLLNPPSMQGQPGSEGQAAAKAASSGSTALFVAGWQSILPQGVDLPYDPVFSAVGGASGPTSLGRTTAVAEVERRETFESQASVSVSSSFEPILIDVRTDSYQAMDGTTYAAFTLSPEPGDAAVTATGLVPFGGIVSLDRPEVTYPLNHTDQFAAAGLDRAVFQTGLGMDPGRYRVLFGLQDPSTGRVGVHQEDITISDFTTAGLTLSSLTLARSLEPLDKDQVPASDLKVPFVMGNLRVVPRTRNTIANGEDFHLYFQVYGASYSPQGTPLLDITYSFEGQSESGWQALGQPIVQEKLHGQVHSWSFPINGWPAGVFRLTVLVKDRVAGTSTSDRLDFTVTQSSTIP